MLDAAAIFPYQYIWFNEPARFFANEENFETDYWGYSLKEASRHARRYDDQKMPIVGWPPHLVASYFPSGRRIVDKEHASALEGGPYLMIALTRQIISPPKNCIENEAILRRELFATRPLKVAFIATCSIIPKSTALD